MFCCNQLFTETLVTTGIPERLTKWKDFSSSCCHQAVYGQKDTGGAYLAQSEGLQLCKLGLKFHFPFCLEVNGIYQNHLCGASYVS